MRALLLAASLLLGSEAWGQVAEHKADIAKFRARLAADVQRFQGRYPPSAREQGLEGTAHIVVSVGTDGKTSCTLKKSTGHEILDQKALSVVRYAASNVPIPEGLRGVAFSTEVRLRFSLQPGGKGAGQLKA